MADAVSEASRLSLLAPCQILTPRPAWWPECVAAITHLASPPYLEGHIPLQTQQPLQLVTGVTSLPLQPQPGSPKPALQGPTYTVSGEALAHVKPWMHLTAL